MTPEEQPYNPLDKQHLGESVAQALLDKPIALLPPASFHGAGIYAIYYAGDYAPYQPLTAVNRNGQWHKPIYVGKAVPAGARKGGFGLGADPGNVLWRRLKEHADSIDLAENLALSDFACRYLVVDDIWIPLAESMLISRFEPLWNKLVDGFGNHDPGTGRYQQKKSAWDLLHPGRPWAEHLRDNPLGIAEWEEKVRGYWRVD